MIQRPIKLRAWDTDSRAFVPVVSLFDETRPIVQFTGMYDANGCEIWEGDIVRWRYIDQHERVYHKCFAQIIFRNGTFGTIGLDLTHDIDYLDNLNMGDTVVGNMFTDSYLLTCNLEITW